MPKAKPIRRPITKAGRQRVERALDRHGLVITQGQWEVPSVADLLADEPITTRGYSWDYVPAWDLCDELAKRRDVGRAKLLRGRSTLISKRLWPAVDALARDARTRILALPPENPERTVLEEIETQPGIPASELLEELELDSRAFQRVKGRLEQKLAIFGLEREDLGYHTHESCWFPWKESKIATGLGSRSSPDLEEATAVLVAAVFPDAKPQKLPRLTTLFPMLR